MATRRHIVVSGCAAALVLALAPFVRSAWFQPAQPMPTSMHGSFAQRFQPKLEAIGSTRDLPPVPLDGAQPAKESHHAPPR